LTRGEIAVGTPRNSPFLSVRWQQQISIARFGWEFDPQMSPSPVGHGHLFNTNVPTKWHVNPSNGLSRVHECDRRQTDRQTDYAAEKCVDVCQRRRCSGCAIL